MSTPRLTKEQAAIIGVYTGVSAGPFHDMHEAAERYLGRPIFTHEFAYPELWDRLRDASRKDFLALCYEEPPE